MTVKLSASNIGWQKEDDKTVLDRLCALGFEGIEIAPTRIVPNNPYVNVAKAKKWKQTELVPRNLRVCSMQSIWYGLSESLWGSAAERQVLLSATKAAIQFAVELECPNLVFGSPQNRNRPTGVPISEAIDFFSEIAIYAQELGTVFAVEPNPTIYQTNFLNTTSEAIIFCTLINSPNLKVNLDVGAMIYNGESLDSLRNSFSHINHIHLSEPLLVPLQKRGIHHELKTVPYDQFISLEMRKTESLDSLLNALDYMKELF